MPHLMKMPRTMTVSDFSLDFHVMGPGYGEAIVVVIGKKIIFGVDSCHSLINSGLDEKSYVENIVSSTVGDPYIIWTLTHFHHDHFVGLGWILRNFPDKIHLVVVPDNYTSKDIAESIRRHARLDAKSEAAYYSSGGEYDQLFSTLLQSDIAPVVCKASPRYAAMDLELRTRDGQSRRLTIDVIGASVDGLSAVIAKQIPKAMGEWSSLSRSFANFGSYIVLISLGRFKAVLLGDAPAKRTQVLPWNYALGEAGASFVKVAHHGAVDGTTEDLLRQLGGKAKSSRRPTIAVVTPFQTQRLPRAEVLHLLRSAGYEVKVTGSKRTKNAVKKAIAAELGFDGGLTIETASSPADEVVISRFR
jgi:hypothetical protein